MKAVALQPIAIGFMYVLAKFQSGQVCVHYVYVLSFECSE